MFHGCVSMFHNRELDDPFHNHQLVKSSGQASCKAGKDSFSATAIGPREAKSQEICGSFQK